MDLVGFGLACAIARLDDVADDTSRRAATGAAVTTRDGRVNALMSILGDAVVSGIAGPGVLLCA